MNKSDVLELFTAIRLRWPSFKMAEESADIWAKGLQKITLDDALQAVEALWQESKYAPAFSEIYQKTRAKRQSKRPDENAISVQAQQDWEADQVKAGNRFCSELINNERKAKGWFPRAWCIEVVPDVWELKIDYVCRILGGKEVTFKLREKFGQNLWKMVNDKKFKDKYLAFLDVLLVEAEQRDNKQLNLGEVF